MGDNNADPHRIFFIRWNKDSRTSGQPDPELMKWLEGFISQLESDGLLSSNWPNAEDQQEPNELEQLEYMDSTVVGDEHPEALAWIMNAYNKHNRNK